MKVKRARISFPRVEPPTKILAGTRTPEYTDGSQSHTQAQKDKITKNRRRRGIQEKVFTRDITFVVYHRGVSLPDDSTLQEEYDISMRHFPRIRVGGGLKNVLCSVCASHVSEILEPRVGFPAKSPLSFRETNREIEKATRCGLHARRRRSAPGTACVVLAAAQFRRR